MTTHGSDSRFKNETAFCPAGTHALGSGFQINNVYGGEVNAVGLGPINPLTESDTVTALEGQAGYPNDWSVTSQAICASTRRPTRRAAARDGRSPTRL